MDYKFLLWAASILLAAAIVVYAKLPFVVFIIVSLLSSAALLPKDITRNPRVIILVFFIVMSLLFINPNTNPQGMKVTHVSKESQLSGVSTGDVIIYVNGKEATPEVLSKNYSGTVIVQTNKGIRYSNVNGSLGIAAENVEFSNLRFGLDLKGGVRAVIEPNTSDKAEVEQIISTLQTRINVYGLREAVFRPVYHENKAFIEVSIASGNEDELRSLLESQGKFEAKIPLILRIRGNESSIKLKGDHKISVGNATVSIEGKEYFTGDVLVLDGIPLEVGGITKDYVNLTSTVFTGSDIKIVFFDPQRSRIENAGDFYRWSFAVQLSKEGAEKFAMITGNLGIVPGGYLDSPIVLYLDGNFIDALSISSDLRGKVVTEVSISGAAPDVQQAAVSRARIQSILRSGALPVSISIVQLENISPNLGVGFIRNALAAMAVAIGGVVAVVSLRYRKMKIVFPMVLISLSEVLIILGFAALVGWTIDLSAIAGIIASVGTGIDAQIIMIDQALRREEEMILTLREKLNRAFFVIFGSAGTVIAAMLPLMIIGFGLLRGFAITTAAGVIIGIAITRPAFGAIVEKII